MSCVESHEPGFARSSLFASSKIWRLNKRCGGHQEGYSHDEGSLHGRGGGLVAWPRHDLWARVRGTSTQLGQLSGWTAGHSSRQMEKVLAPLHVWTGHPPLAASTAGILADPSPYFKDLRF
ncbi:hypothetical protein AOLI_G00114310 [Acnodon oligacanthus]